MRTYNFSWLSVAVIAVVSVAVYFNTLSSGFVYDDHPLVEQNLRIRDIKNIPGFFSSSISPFRGEHTNYYRPLINIFFTVVYHIFGPSPLGFHLLNVFFHTCVSVLVYMLACIFFHGYVSVAHASDGEPKIWRLLSPAFISGLFFVVHPVHTEAVAWISGITDLSFSFFSLLSLFFYLRPSTDLKGYSVVSLSFFCAALLCKETAISMLAILPACDFALGKKPLSAASLKRYAPYLAAAIAYLIVRSAVLGGFAPVRQHAGLSIYQTAINVLPLFTQYFFKLVFPVDLNLYHIFHPISSLMELRGLMSLGFTVLFAFSLLLAGRRNRILFIGLLFFLMPLAPALYISGVGQNTFAERYLYLPSFGFVLLAGLFIARLGRRPKTAAVTAAASMLVIVVCSLGAAARNTVWKDDYTLWSDAVTKSPEGFVPQTMMGDIFFQKGDLDKAIERYLIAITLHPASVNAHNNLGLAYLSAGRPEDAIGQFRIALRLNPDSAETHNNLGIAYKSKGLLDQAISEYESALRIDPYQPGLYYNLARTYELKGDTVKAEQAKQAYLKARNFPK